MGGCLSALIFLITMLYTVQNVIVLKERGATMFTSSELVDEHSNDLVVTAEEGFRIAFALDNSSGVKPANPLKIRVENWKDGG